MTKGPTDSQLLDFVLEHGLTMRTRPRTRLAMKKSNPRRKHEWTAGVERNSSEYGRWWQVWGVGATRITALRRAFKTGPRGWDD